MKDNKRVVITYGTFDLFHQGHYNILKRAKEQGDYLIVGVTGETYDIERGKLSVQDSLATRIKNVEETGFADMVIVEEYLGQKIQDIIKYSVDVLVIGSDWKGKFDHLRKYCEVVYLERTKNISSTMLRESREVKSLGIVTDDLNDDDFIIESKYVSGIHPESVYSADEEVAEGFFNKFELDRYFTDYDEFLDNVDVIYVRCDRAKKYPLIKKALEKNIIVMSSPMLSNSAWEIQELYRYAEEKGGILMECVSTFYLQAFVQLLWNAKGNLIGDIVSIRCGIRIGDLPGVEAADFQNHLYVAMLTAEKFFGTDIKFHLDSVRDADDFVKYGVLTGKAENGIFLCEMGDSNTDTTMKITGTEGTIIIPEDWWYTCHFELNDNVKTKRYSWNFEGNGIRYIVMSALNKAKSASAATDLRVPTNEVLKAIQSIGNEI